MNLTEEQIAGLMAEAFPMTKPSRAYRELARLAYDLGARSTAAQPGEQPSTMHDTTGTQALWPQMIAALAAIDAELGLPEDGCNSLTQTLAAIRKLKAAPPAASGDSTPPSEPAAYMRHRLLSGAGGFGGGVVVEFSEQPFGGFDDPGASDKNATIDPLYTHPQAAPGVDSLGRPLIGVSRDDANNYCRILTLLGMEEEGDPVDRIAELLAKCEEHRDGRLAALERVGTLECSLRECGDLAASSITGPAQVESLKMIEKMCSGSLDPSGALRPEPEAAGQGRWIDLSERLPPACADVWLALSDTGDVWGSYTGTRPHDIRDEGGCSHWMLKQVKPLPPAAASQQADREAE